MIRMTCTHLIVSVFCGNVKRQHFILAVGLITQAFESANCKFN